MKCANEQLTTHGNKTLPQYLIVFITLIILISAGTHLGWPSPSIPILLSKDFPLNITDEDAAFITTISNVGQIVGSIVFSLLLNRIGRKFSLLMTGPLFLLSFLLIHFSPASVVLLYVARFIGGMAEAGTAITIPIYIAEVVEPKIRGILSSFILAAITCGSLFINVIGAYNSIQTTSLILMTFPIIFLVLFVFAPRSPYYLLMKNKDLKAGKSLQILRGNRHVDEELNQIKQDVERQMSEKGRLQDLFLIKSNRKALVIVSMVEILQVFSGVPTLTMYAQTFFAEASDAIPEVWAAVLMQSLKVLTMLIASKYMDSLGRKPLLIFSASGCSILLTLVSIFFFLKDYTSIPVGDYSWLALVGILIFMMIFVLGVGIAGKCLMGELFSASVKAEGVCLANIFNAACVFASTNLYSYLSTNYTTGAPLLMFGLIQFCGVGFCWWYVPETKKKTLEEIQQDLKL